MLNSTKTRDLRGKYHSICNSQSVSLDDPNAIWIVESGCVAVFATTVDDRTESTRRYLFSVNQGEALFGCSPVPIGFLTGSAQANRQLVAVPIGEATLLKVDRDCIEEFAASSDIRLINWIETWLQQMDLVLAYLPKSATQPSVKIQTHFSLIEGQIFQPEPDSVIWVQIQQGAACWLGFQEFILTPSTDILPLTRCF